MSKKRFYLTYTKSKTENIIKKETDISLYGNICFLYNTKKLYIEAKSRFNLILSNEAQEFLERYKRLNPTMRTSDKSG